MFPWWTCTMSTAWYVGLTGSYPVSPIQQVEGGGYLCRNLCLLALSSRVDGMLLVVMMLDAWWCGRDDIDRLNCSSNLIFESTLIDFMASTCFALRKSKTFTEPFLLLVNLSSFFLTPNPPHHDFILSTCPHRILCLCLAFFPDSGRRNSGL